jgi:hypothetical protein
MLYHLIVIHTDCPELRVEICQTHVVFHCCPIQFLLCPALPKQTTATSWNFCQLTENVILTLNPKNEILISK